MQRHPRHGDPHGQVLLLDDLEAREPFQNIEHYRRRHDAVSNIRIAVFPIWKIEAESRDLLPERLIAQRIEPLVDIGLIFEVSHATSMPDWPFRLQIAADNRGRS